jgi:glycosyltransferase involved in cell wall biosynthesis
MELSIRPLVSVIIPTYNSSKYIEETINSVLNQSYQNFEIIVIDDSSTDKTISLLKILSESDSRISYYEIKHSGMPSTPRNYGINKAKGDLIAFLDSDDIWTENKLQEQLKYFQKFQDTIFVYSMSVTFGAVNFLSPNYEVLPLLFKAAKSKEDLKKKGNSITCSSVLVKSEALKKINGFDEDPKLKAVEDYDLWIRLSELGKFYFIPRIHVKYRVHKSQTSSSWEIKQNRLLYLAQKRNIELPKYKFYRNKGFVFRLVRNTIHFSTFVWIRLVSKFSKNY